MYFLVPGGKDGSSNLGEKSLVDETKDANKVGVFRLRDEFGDYPDVVDRTLCVCESHGAIKEVDLAEFARVVVT